MISNINLWKLHVMSYAISLSVHTLSLSEGTCTIPICTHIHCPSLYVHKLSLSVRTYSVTLCTYIFCHSLYVHTVALSVRTASLSLSLSLSLHQQIHKLLIFQWDWQAYLLISSFPILCSDEVNQLVVHSVRSCYWHYDK